MAKRQAKAGNDEVPAQRRISDDVRDHLFPPRILTAREEGVEIAARLGGPLFDWRPMLNQRFGIDGNRTSCQLDGVDPGEPDRYDFSDMQEAHALAHVPIWLIDPSHVKLVLDYGYTTPSTFRLALLMVEADPFQDVEGVVFGPLLPSVAMAARASYDPFTDTTSFKDEEMAFRGQAVAALLERLEQQLTDPRRELEFRSTDPDMDVFKAAFRSVALPRRFSRADADVPVAQVGNNSFLAVSRYHRWSGDEVVVATVGTPGRRTTKPQTMRVTFYIVGSSADGMPSQGMVCDGDGNQLLCGATFDRKSLGEAKRDMQDSYGIPPQAWADFR